MQSLELPGLPLLRLRCLGVTVPSFATSRSRLSYQPRSLVAAPSSKLARISAAAAAASAVASRRALRLQMASLSSTAATEARPQHGQLLPLQFTSRVPPGDAQVLSFVLAFLEKEGLRDVPVYINGGYVRDLLLGKLPDDLDLTLCLQGCPAEVTVSGLLERLPDFAVSRPDLGIVEVKIATILSNESKDKQLDTFKAHFVDPKGVKIEVDVMPTIGEEMYGDDNRIPIRDQRGTPEQDAIRRDLTIGALLLRVLPPASTGGSLQYELLDFYGGVEDIQRGLLRSPCPSGKSAAQVAEAVLRTAADVELAKKLGLADSTEEAFVVQTLWWAKVLMDDPLRICRALRFAAKFRFKLHESFWSAVPFALEPLRVKVAGSRKNTEYQKIGSYGHAASQEFFELAFTHSFGPPGGPVLRLAPALFGGQDEKSRPKPLPEVVSFDLAAFRGLAAALQPEAEEQPATEVMGSMLAASLASAELGDGSESTLQVFNYVCDGMCVSNAMREAGVAPLQAASALAAAPSHASNRLDSSVAGAIGVSVDELLLHVQVWESLQIVVPRSGPASAFPRRRQFALALVKRFALASKAEQVAECAKRLSYPRSLVKGFLLKSLQVPRTLSRQVLILFEVVLRLLCYAEPLDDEAGLKQLLKVHPQLGQAFAASVWMQEDGQTLREEFQEAMPKKPAKRSK